MLAFGFQVRICSLDTGKALAETRCPSDAPRANLCFLKPQVRDCAREVLKRGRIAPVPGSELILLVKRLSRDGKTTAEVSAASDCASSAYSLHPSENGVDIRHEVWVQVAWGNEPLMPFSISRPDGSMPMSDWRLQPMTPSYNSTYSTGVVAVKCQTAVDRFVLGEQSFEGGPAFWTVTIWSTTTGGKAEDLQAEVPVAIFQFDIPPSKPFSDLSLKATPPITTQRPDTITLDSASQKLSLESNRAAVGQAIRNLVPAFLTGKRQKASSGSPVTVKKGLRKLRRVGSSDKEGSSSFDATSVDDRPTSCNSSRDALFLSTLAVSSPVTPQMSASAFAQAQAQSQVRRGEKMASTRGKHRPATSPGSQGSRDTDQSSSTDNLSNQYNLKTVFLDDTFQECHSGIDGNAEAAADLNHANAQRILHDIEERSEKASVRSSPAHRDKLSSLSSRDGRKVPSGFTPTSSRGTIDSDRRVTPPASLTGVTMGLSTGTGSPYSSFGPVDRPQSAGRAPSETKSKSVLPPLQERSDGATSSFTQRRPSKFQEDPPLCEVSDGPEYPRQRHPYSASSQQLTNSDSTATSKEGSSLGPVIVEEPVEIQNEEAGVNGTGKRTPSILTSASSKIVAMKRDDASDVVRSRSRASNESTDTFGVQQKQSTKVSTADTSTLSAESTPNIRANSLLMHQTITECHDEDRLIVTRSDRMSLPSDDREVSRLSMDTMDGDSSDQEAERESHRLSGTGTVETQSSEGTVNRIAGKELDKGPPMLGHTSRRIQGDRTRAASGQGTTSPSTSQALLRVSEPPSPPPTAPLPLPPLPAGNQTQPVMMVPKAGLASLAAQVHAVISGGEDQHAPMTQSEKGKSKRMETIRPQTAPDVILTSRAAPMSHAGSSSVASLQKGSKSVAFLRHRPKVGSIAVESVNSNEQDDDDNDSEEGSNVSSDLSRTSEDVMKKLSEVQRLRALHSELDLQRLRLASQARETLLAALEKERKGWMERIERKKGEVEELKKAVEKGGGAVVELVAASGLAASTEAGALLIASTPRNHDDVCEAVEDAVSQSQHIADVEGVMKKLTEVASVALSRAEVEQTSTKEKVQVFNTTGKAIINDSRVGHVNGH